MPDPKPVSGWGRSTISAARVVRAVGTDDMVQMVRQSPPRGLLARGLGRSYNDSAQNAGGTLVDTGVHHVELDPDTGVVDAGSAVSFDDLMHRLVPRGWFVPVTPGTRFVTVGGAIASDVHGKNHHTDGSFGDHVLSIDLLTPDGSLRRVGPDGDHDERSLFWATVGGLGLTGLVVSCRFRCLPIETSRMVVETVRTADLDETMAVLASADEDPEGARYSVAWLDLLARGPSLGRGVVTLGDHAPAAAVGSGDPLGFDARQLASVPPWYDLSVLNRASIAAFNEVWYRKAPRHRTGEIQSIPWYFHPLDAVGAWNRLYGRRGFVQYQMVVPIDAADVVRATAERFASERVPSFLVVLKRFGPENPGALSFPMPGWTLAVDVPAGVPGLAGLLDAVDRDVVGAGGRVYLAKDGRVDPALVPAMYPRLDEWRAIIESLGHTGTIDSDLDRRLGLRRPHP